MKNDQKFSGLLLLKIPGGCGRKDERKLLEVYHLMVLLSLTERTAIEVVIFFAVLCRFAGEVGLYWRNIELDEKSAKWVVLLCLQYAVYLISIIPVRITYANSFHPII